MNENADQSQPNSEADNPSSSESSSSNKRRTFSYWARRLLACNPFYLVSAALLLFGCYKVSTEPEMLRQNSLHLYFNFGSLQFYELLLVTTAIFLARRRIWYDSTLLVGLENLLLVVPFILISQGALIGEQWTEKVLTWDLSLAAGILAILRIGGLKKFMGELNFPRPAIFLAVTFLIVNVALPIVYRELQEKKFGTHIEAGPAYNTNECVWMFLLPTLCALALLVPAPLKKAESWPEKGWLPAGMFGLWLAGTAVHLYCLGYIYDFTLRGELIAPALWVLCWIIYRRAADLKLSQLRETTLLVPPLVATLVAISSGTNKVFFPLMLLNAAGYAFICFKRGHQFALHLLVVSLGSLVGFFPEDWGRRIFSAFNRADCLWGAIAAYCLFWIMRSRNPVGGVLGCILLGMVAGFGLGDRPEVWHWATQAGLVFVLVHSLRWQDQFHPGAALVRSLACAILVVHAFLWLHSTGSFWMKCVPAICLAIAYTAARLITGKWGPRIIPLAVLLVLLSSPADISVIKLRSCSIGILAMIGSFVLFALGTLAALTRHRWHREPH